MRKSFLIVLSVIIFIMGLFLVSCQKQEEPETKAPAAGYGEKAKEAVAGYGEKAKEAVAGYGEKAPGYGEKAPGYGEKKEAK